jgi:hypothetical protein
MNVQPNHPGLKSETEAFLSGTVQRIQRTTIILGVTGSIAATVFFGWRSGLGAGIGSVVGYVNLMWLYQHSTMLIERLIAPAGKMPSKLRLMLSFCGRYVFVIVIACVILKGFSYMLLGFIVALFFPILAAMCEGAYEGWLNMRDDINLH